jgi:upstream activation factor subunit UAF30
MAKTVKPKTDAQATTTTTTTAPVVEKTAAAPKAKKAKAPKSEETVVAAVSAETVAVDASTTAVVEATVEASIAEQSLEFFAKLQQIGTLISSLKVEYRSLEKKMLREVKLAQKAGSKRKRKPGNRAPSGFVKPTKISDELASFLGKDKGTEMARTSVTREINDYIRTNKLQDTSNGRKINPDAKLASLLKLKEDDILTYFNLQKFMSPHFEKSVKAQQA